MMEAYEMEIFRLEQKIKQIEKELSYWKTNSEALKKSREKLNEYIERLEDHCGDWLFIERERERLGL